MQIPSILPTSIQSTRPSKRKIVKAVYNTEKFTKNVQKDLPKELRGFAQYVSDACHKARNYMTKVD